MTDLPVVRDKNGNATMAKALGRGRAQKEARTIREYWSGRGRTPTVWVAPVMQTKDANGDTRIGYGVRSDMVNGVPKTVKGVFRDEFVPLKALRAAGKGIE